jgi:ABC-type nitrate/sulfonate/bicarbonate transport system substrate-binding protein
VGLPLQYPWSAYFELQDRDAALCRTGDVERGIADGLNHMLTVIETRAVPLNPDELARSLKTVVATGRWNTRNQARLRLKFSSELGNGHAPDPELALIAQERLRQVQGCLPGRDWRILRFVGEGFSYEEIADLTGLTSASLRTRVSRLRRQLLY